MYAQKDADVNLLPRGMSKIQPRQEEGCQVRGGSKCNSPILSTETAYALVEVC